MSQTFARTLHDLGLASWFGGSLMGAIGLNAASGVVEDPSERSRVASAGWARWTPANLAGIGAYLLGGALLTRGNRGRLRAQKGVGRTTMLKTLLTLVTLGATAYSRALGQRIMSAGDPPVEDGTTPTAGTPEDVAASQRQLKVLQWAIPVHVAGLIALSARMGEQQRPGNVAAGTMRRIWPAA